MGENIHGWFVLNKPIGVTSAKMVNRVKRAVGVKKVGHAGTLDPLATGVLPIAVGEATKTVRFLMEGFKTYRFTIRWGVSTKTDDSEGEIVATSGSRPSKSSIARALRGFIGEINQVPPAFSAIKINGKRAYNLARNHPSFKILPRLVKVETFVLLDMPDKDEATFEIKCGKGTYIRSVARDLGQELNTFAHVKKLRRTVVGPFSGADAISLDYLEGLGHSAANSEYFFDIKAVLAGIPALALKSDDVAKVRHGQAVPLQRALKIGEKLEIKEGREVATFFDGKVFALAKVKDGEIKPHRILNT